MKFFNLVFAYCIFFLINSTVFPQAFSNDNGMFTLAQNYEQSGQLEKAEEIYKQLFDKNNSNYTFFDALNKIYIKQKKYSESILLLESKINKTPQDVNLYGLIGSTYFMKDNSEEAFKWWDRGVSINPTNVVNYRVIANYAIENRAFEKAIEILSMGKKQSNDSMIFSLDLANIYSLNMRFEDAASEYCNLLILRPDQIGSVKSRIASYLQRQGAVDPTIKTIKKFAEQTPIPSILDLLVFVYTSRGLFNEAFETAVEYDKKTTSTGDYVYIFAQDAHRSGNFDAAEKAFKYVIENYPESKLIPITKIGYANTLAEKLSNQKESVFESWKPLKIFKTADPEKYKGVITAYEELANDFPNNAIYPQAVFNMAKIYADKLYDLTKSDSLLNIIATNHAMSSYGVLANIELGKISVKINNLDKAASYFTRALKLRGDKNIFAEANFYLAKIEFWKGRFWESLNILKKATSDLSTDFTNDALEFSILINSSKKDSLNLFKYAQADLYLFQNKHEIAANEFKTLADNPNLFIINEFSEIKFSEILIATNKLPEAVKRLENFVENSKTSIFVDKAIFLCAQTYQFGIMDKLKAAQNYQKILEKFPNSLYFDRARDCLKDLQTKNG